MAYISPELHQISTAVYGRDMRKVIHDSIEKVNNDVETKEPTIDSGTTSQYWRGDKTWTDFSTSVRNSTLSGLSTSANLAISASDNVLTAFGKLQAQTNARLKLSGGTMSGNINMGSYKITSSSVPSADNDYVNKKYADSQDALKENKSNKGVANGYASLDSNGKVPKSQISLTKSDVGLGNADNTPDASKNVLSASKLTTARKINGVAFDGSSDITIYDTTKEPTIDSGTTSQYWRGDKTWTDFSTSVRNSTLTGLSAADNTEIADGDNILSAFGKLQAQINTKTHTHSNKTLLDEITSERIAGWDGITAQVTQAQFDEYKEYIQDICFGFAEDIQNIYIAFGVNIFDGGIFGMEQTGAALDGGSFDDNDLPDFDCGEFDVSAGILSAVTIDGGNY